MSTVGRGSAQETKMPANDKVTIPDAYNGKRLANDRSFPA